MANRISRETWIGIIIFSIVVAAVVFVFLAGDEQALRTQTVLRLETEQQRGTMMIANQIEGVLTQFFSDYAIIYNSSEISGYLGETTDDRLGQLSSLFARYLAQKPYMLSVRFFDAAGNKLIEVNQSIPLAPLSAAEERRLVESVIAHREIDFYIAPSEGSFKGQAPRVTFASSLAVEGDFVGILAIDYDGCTLVSYMAEHQDFSTTLIHYEIISPDGLAVHAVGQACEAVVLVPENRFATYPTLQSVIKEQKTGTVSMGEDTVSWHTLAPTLHSWISPTEAQSAPWIVLSTFNHQRAVQGSDHLRLRHPIIKYLIAFIAFLGSSVLFLLFKLRGQDRHQAKVSSLVAEFADNGIVVCEADGTIAYANQAFLQYSGRPLSSLVGQSTHHYRSTLAKDNGLAGPCWLIHRDGDRFLYAHSIVTVSNARRSDEQQVETFLPSKWTNQATITEQIIDLLLDQPHLMGSLEEQGELTALVLRIQNGVEISAGFNLSERTAFMIRLAATLRSLCKTEFGICAFSFDTYLIFMGDTSMDRRLVKKINEVLGVLQSRAKEGSKGVNLRTVCGIANFPHTSKTLQALVADALLASEMALLEKEKSYLFFTDEVRTFIRRRELIAGALDVLFSTDQLFLSYQPIVSVATSHIVGAEALIRWNHPTLGLLMPGEFLSVLVASGYSEHLGRFVIAAAVAFITTHGERLAEHAPHFTLSINFGIEEFINPALTDYLGGMLRAHQIGENHLTIELTEHAAIENFQSANSIINKLRSQGLMIAIDDFGTGFSSLSYLLELAVDKIKIDRSFIARYREDESVTIYQTVMLLARQIKAKVVAEGVETEEQLAFIKEIGCDEYQGFYFSRAIEEQDFLALLEKTNKKGAP